MKAKFILWLSQITSNDATLYESHITVNINLTELHSLNKTFAFLVKSLLRLFNDANSGTSLFWVV